MENDNCVLIAQTEITESMIHHSLYHKTDIILDLETGIISYDRIEDVPNLLQLASYDEVFSVAEESGEDLALAAQRINRDHAGAAAAHKEWEFSDKITDNLIQTCLDEELDLLLSIKDLTIIAGKIDNLSEEESENHYLVHSFDDIQSFEKSGSKYEQFNAAGFMNIEFDAAIKRFVDSIEKAKEAGEDPRKVSFPQLIGNSGWISNRTTILGAYKDSISEKDRESTEALIEDFSKHSEISEADQLLLKILIYDLLIEKGKLL